MQKNPKLGSREDKKSLKWAQKKVDKKDGKRKGE